MTNPVNKTLAKFDAAAQEQFRLEPTANTALAMSTLAEAHADAAVSGVTSAYLMRNAYPAARTAAKQRIALVRGYMARSSNWEALRGAVVA